MATTPSEPGATPPPVMFEGRLHPFSWMFVLLTQLRQALAAGAHLRPQRVASIGEGAGYAAKPVVAAPQAAPPNHIAIALAGLGAGLRHRFGATLRRATLLRSTFLRPTLG